MSGRFNMRLLGLTSLALIAFAANSLLARAGLVNPDMGASEFTIIRLLSGALMLSLLLHFRPTSPDVSPVQDGASWRGAAMLLLYALMFSLAYVTLDTGLGALCLFTVVQLTVLGAAAVQKDLSRTDSLGALIAFGGFVYLIGPSLGTSSGIGILMMALSGFGWGVYTLLGRGAKAPLRLTAHNFTRASVLALPLLIFIWPSPELSMEGVVFAVLSGALTSGCGYAIWYAALPKLRTSIAGVCQLLVPPIAAFMGWAVLGEALTLRLIFSTVIILGGLMIAAIKPPLKTS